MQEEKDAQTNHVDLIPVQFPTSTRSYDVGRFFNAPAGSTRMVKARSKTSAHTRKIQSRRDAPPPERTKTFNPH
jgi:hypothetical protein